MSSVEHLRPENRADLMTPAQWKRLLKPFEQRSDLRCWWELVATFGPFVALLAGAGWLYLNVSVLASLPVSVAAGLFLVRVFILQHDAGHGIYFESPLLRHSIGFLCGCLTFTPYVAWARFHSRHHAISSNLDRRDEIFDVPLLTVREYEALPWHERLKYQTMRRRWLVVLAIPTLLFVFLHRVTVGNPKPSAAERWSVVLTNLGIAALVAGFSYFFGPLTVFAVYAPCLLVAMTLGLWIVYTEHQYADTYWATRDEWDFVTAGLQGSSFLKLPEPLAWITGYIGYHHIHHLDPVVPFYNLKRCHESLPELKQVPHLTIGDAWRSLRLALWDEQAQELISFAEHARRRRLRDTPPADRATPSPAATPAATV